MCLRVYCFTRVHEFFQDFDKLRANAIPHKKFVSGLTMALAKTGLHLTEADLMAITEYFKAEKVESTTLSATIDMVRVAAHWQFNCTDTSRPDWLTAALRQAACAFLF